MSVTVTKYGNLSKAINEGNELAILELVTKVTAAAKVLSPVDLGGLHNSIMGRVKSGDKLHEGGPRISPVPKSNEGYVGTALLYGIYQEFGTRNMKPQPYLRPAIAQEANGRKAAAVVAGIQKKWVKEKMARDANTSKVYQ